MTLAISPRQQSAPVGWKLVRTVDEFTKELHTGKYDTISLDYDLADPNCNGSQMNLKAPKCKACLITRHAVSSLAWRKNGRHSARFFS